MTLDISTLLETPPATELPSHETVAVTKIVVFGATGRIGRRVVAEAAARGWRVRAATRSPSALEREAAVRDANDMVVPWAVAFDDEASVESAVGECDAVIDCLGPRRNALVEVGAFAAAARAILEAMARTRVERLVCLSGAAVRTGDDQLGPFDRFMRALVGSRAPYVLAAKQVEFEAIRKSDVAWTALRPPLVVDGSRTGRYRLAEAAPGFGSRIRRTDCAVALCDQVTTTDWICRAPFLWSPGGHDAASVA